jgi:hypothetical protein
MIRYSLLQACQPILHWLKPESQALIVAAADQILAMLRPPVQTFTEMSFGMYGMATLAFVIDTNIPDILKEAGATVCLGFLFLQEILTI